MATAKPAHTTPAATSRPVEKPVVRAWKSTLVGTPGTASEAAAPDAAAPAVAPAPAAIWLVMLCATDVQAIVPMAARPMAPPMLPRVQQPRRGALLLV